MLEDQQPLQPQVWQCPACWARLDAAGPQLMRLAIAMHIQEAHERKPAPEAPAKVVYDAAFYAGDRLTPYDKGQFLAALHVSWAAELPLLSEPK